MTKSNDVIKVLVVDDSALMRRVLGNLLGAQDDMRVETARDGLEAIERVHVFQPDVVTLDVNMPRMDGLACLDRIMLERPCPVVMLSSLTASGADVTLQALQLGAVDFFAKPTGAVSLSLDELGVALVGKIRVASKARLPASLRLKERVRLRTGVAEPSDMFGRYDRPSRSAATDVVPAAMPGIVLVGTSTGGPQALDVLLAGLPADFAWPIAIAQHMPASFTGPLAARLNKTCALRVVEVTQPMVLARGTVYIGKGDADLIVSMRANGPTVLAAPALAEHRWHPSVDRLVTSAIQQLGAERIIGVLMTGMGSDGAAAMTQLRAQGGRTIAEAEDTAVIWGMPGELVRAGGAQVVAPLREIAGQLLDWTR